MLRFQSPHHPLPFKRRGTGVKLHLFIPFSFSGCSSFAPGASLLNEVFSPRSFTLTSSMGGSALWPWSPSLCPELIVLWPLSRLCQRFDLFHLAQHQQTGLYQGWALQHGAHLSYAAVWVASSHTNHSINSAGRYFGLTSQFVLIYSCNRGGLC